MREASEDPPPHWEGMTAMGRLLRSLRVPILASVVLISACASGSDSQSGISDEQVGSEPSVETFVEILSETGGDHYVYSSVEEIVRASDVVISARIAGIQNGRTLTSSDRDYSEASEGLDTIAFEVSDVRVLGGSDPSLVQGQTFYIETFAPVEDHVDQLKLAVPIGERVVLLLTDYTSPNRARIDGAEEGARYLFPHAQGFILELDGKPVSALGGISDPADLSSLDEVIEAILDVER